jgi:hypothetical protein
MSCLAITIGLCCVSTLTSADISIPRLIEIDRLTELVRDRTKFDIVISSAINRQAAIIQLPILSNDTNLWIAYTQALADQEIAVVLASEAGEEPSYRVVPLRDAAKASVIIDVAYLTKMMYPPGYVSVTLPLRFLGIEAATSVATPVVGASGAIRPLGAGQPTLVISGLFSAVQAAIRLLTSLDAPDSQPVVRSIVPTHASPQRAQATVSAAWASMQKLGAVTGQADILISADGSALLLVGHPTAVTQMERLVASVDVSEPLKTETYRPQRYPIAEVANLIEQVLGTGAMIKLVKIYRSQIWVP